MPVDASQDVIKPQKILVTEEEENYIVKTSDGLNSKSLSEALLRLGRAVFSDNKKRDDDV